MRVRKGPGDKAADVVKGQSRRYVGPQHVLVSLAALVGFFLVSALYLGLLAGRENPLGTPDISMSAALKGLRVTGIKESHGDGKNTGLTPLSRNMQETAVVAGSISSTRVPGGKSRPQSQQPMASSQQPGSSSSNEARKQPTPRVHHHTAGSNFVRPRAKHVHSTCPVGDRSGLFTLNHTMDQFFSRLIARTDNAQYQPSVLSRDPWIVQFDAFYSRKQCQSFIAACDWWAPDVSPNSKGSHSNFLNRNSSSFSCGSLDSCSQRPGIREYREKVATVLGVGHEHSEDLNVLRYEPGGFYRKHHDYVLREYNPDHDNCGPRVLTLFAYLSDVEEGGGTEFFHLGVVVKPKAGRAVLFADTFSSKPFDKDERTAHEALMVVKGTKYITTTWIHQYDMLANQKSFCCHRWSSSGKQR